MREPAPWPDPNVPPARVREPRQSKEAAGKLALTVLLAANIAAPAMADGITLTPGRYQLQWHTLLPHLEEMRRMVETDLRCLNGDPAQLFPVLDQPALRGCKLWPASDTAGFSHRLRCQSELVATGRARIETTVNGLKGELEIKMGGKNMTFSQSVLATHRGDCDAGADSTLNVRRGK